MMEQVVAWTMISLLLQNSLPLEGFHVAFHGKMYWSINHSWAYRINQTVHDALDQSWVVSEGLLELRRVHMMAENNFSDEVHKVHINKPCDDGREPFLWWNTSTQALSWWLRTISLMTYKYTSPETGKDNQKTIFRIRCTSKASP